MESGLPHIFDYRAIPTFSISGGSGSKRRTFVQAMAKALAEQGLTSAVVHKHSSHRWNYELVNEPGMDFACDLILLDAPGQSSQVVLMPAQGPSSSGEGLVLDSLDKRGQMESTLVFLVDKLTEIWRRTPVWACVLIGGRSSRMGRPKHLITDNKGITWLQRTVGLIEPHCDGIVVSGQGVVPESLTTVPRLLDVPGPVGPLAGILSAMRWYPAASWILVACDMPDIMEEALDWLLTRRRPGIWGTMPRLQKDGPVEPLLAHYDFRCRPFFEDMADRGCLRLGVAAENPKVETPTVPQRLLPSWRNVNSPEELT